jgi:RNA recognition motif-containing protein
MNIFVANLNFKLKDNDLKELFEDYGTVSTARVIYDRNTRRSKGYGFVEMPMDDEAAIALRELDGKEVMGKAIACKKAFDKTEEKPKHHSTEPENE